MFYSDTPSTGCETPPAPINGNFTIFGDNLLVEYVCDDGFYMYGERYGACISSEQKWTEDPPKCLGKLYFSGDEGRVLIPLKSETKT